jgi:hypothetical protein
MEFFAWLDQLDKNIFTAIQEQLGVAWLDSAMLLLRNATTWIPLYLFVLLWIFKNASPHAVSFIVLTIITFAFCDFVSASVLKPLVGRLRPCYDTDVASTVRGLIGCGGRFSFPSSHAANHFGYRQAMALAMALGGIGLLCPSICGQALSLGCAGWGIIGRTGRVVGRKRV